ncbi:MAG TPA: nucleotide exchange factor GrpE [Gammaproteobacteria bacterium]|nr:nucleotide exchange factor GrpE [Gammaproteobacteria bacterium]
MIENGGNGDPQAKHHEADAPAGSTAQDRADAARDEEIEALRAEARENWEKYLRSVAELDNVRKRSQRELENARRFGIERFAAAILPVRDSLEAALASADTVDVATLLEGERATLRLLDQALENAGVREIDPQGQPFDPTKHEAMTLQPSVDLPPDTVAVVVQKGYELNDRLLRPARVIVTARPEGGEA